MLTMHPPCILEPMKIEKSECVIKSYSFDATGIVFEPEGVVFAESEKDVIDTVRHCLKTKTPVIPRGAGSGFTGGSLPVKGGILLSLERLNRIIDIDTKNMVAEVEAGVVTGELRKSVESFGFYYPPDPSSLEFSTIGGNIAENAGGPRAVKYGVTGDYVLGIKAVLGTAEVIDTTKRLKKNVVGYNLTPLFVGSEGTLGVITRALLKIIPKPETRRLILSYFPELTEAGKAVTEIMASGIKPSALEIMDRASVECVKRYKGFSIPQNTEAILLIEVDGTKEEVRKYAREIVKILKAHSAKTKTARNEKEEEEVWALRRAISPSLLHIAPTKINEDVVVPVDKMAQALDAFRKIGKLYGVPVVCFGHAGDGNIHVNVMTDEKDERLFERAKKAVREIFIATVALGGSLSGEHGIGITKEKFLPIQVKKEEIHLWRRIKKAFDPENIINPGKMGLI